MLISMKNIFATHSQNAVIRTLFFVILLFGSYNLVNAQTKEEMNIAMQKAETIGHIFLGNSKPLDDDFNAQQYCYIAIQNSNVRIMSKGYYIGFVAGRSIWVVPAGHQTLELVYLNPLKKEITRRQHQENIEIVTVSYQIEESDIATIEATFEPRELHSINTTYRNKVLVPTLTENNIPNIAEVVKDIDKRIVYKEDYDQYVNWCSKHRGELDGTYLVKNGTLQITFSGDRFNIRDYTSFSANTAVYEGRYWFNDQTIILCADSLRSVTQTVRGRPGKERIESIQSIQTLYYKLNNTTIEVLDTYGAKLSEAGLYSRSSIAAAEELAQTNISGQSISNTDSGMASADIAWHIENGTLIVSGKGEIPGNPSWTVALPQITDAIIGDGITGIGHHAFAMSKISSIVIGKDVTSLKTYALFNCNDLTVVEVKNPEPPKVGAFVFMGTPIGKAKLIVPAGSKAAYLKSSSWKKFGSIEER